MVTAAKSDREFCAACGWPLRGMRCEACGVESMQLALADATPAEIEAEREIDPGGDKAAEAFRNKEWTRYVGLVVGAEGGATARTVAADDGPGWIATIAGAAVFVSLELVSLEVVVEAPVVRLPREQRVAVLRAALEGLGPKGTPVASPVQGFVACVPASLAHAVLRDDLLLLRARVRLSAAAPSALRRALRDVGETAHRAVLMLSTAFLARPAVAASDRAHVAFDALGARRRLAKAIADPTPVAAAEPVRAAPPPAVPTLAPAPAPARSRDESAPELEVEEVAGESIPPILAPLLAEPKKKVPSTPPPASPPAPPRKSMPPPLPPRPVRSS
ncbi:MAG TPA: zinc ribbon domain-containing protein, partial [Minicystis sp.]|nr:zinc ribbon domain-containing protein [Minicystis sp.]